MTSIKPGAPSRRVVMELRDAAPKIDPSSGVRDRSRLLELLTLADGFAREWSPYGQTKSREAQVSRQYLKIAIYSGPARSTSPVWETHQKYEKEYEKIKL